MKSFRFTMVLLTISLTMACTRPEQTSTDSQNDDEGNTAANTGGVDSISDPADDEDINDEDYGGPGILDTQVALADLEEPVQTFFINFQQRTLGEVISTDGYLIFIPGPGVKPLVNFETDETGILGLNEITLLMNDPIFTKSQMAFFKWPFDPCDYEGFPDGIYSDMTYLENFDLKTFDEANQPDLEKMNAFLSKLEYRYSYDFYIKFSLEDGSANLLKLRTCLSDGKLRIFLIDQRDCGV